MSTPRKKKTSIEMPSLVASRRITAAAKRDPDAQPLTDEELQSMVPLRSIRGRPRLETRKILVSVRYSPEVIEYFKATGQGWQTRMDSVLRKYVARHTREPAR